MLDLTTIFFAILVLAVIIGFTYYNANKVKTLNQTLEDKKAVINALVEHTNKIEKETVGIDSIKPVKTKGLAKATKVKKQKTEKVKKQKPTKTKKVTTTTVK